MTKKKFYHNKEFVKLQSKWYDKLKKSGFEDIEWYNPKTGLGQGSPFLKSDNIPDTGQIRKAYAPELENHFRLCRNFRANGPFYPHLRQNYRNSGDLRAKYAKLKDYLATFEEWYTTVDYKVWDAYTEGATIRDISAMLRSLYRQKKLGKPPKQWGSSNRRHTWGRSSNGEPYSIYWVKHRLDFLKLANIKFNHTHPDGIDVWGEEDDEDFDISDNRGSF